MQTEMIGKLIVRIIAHKLIRARHEDKKEAEYFYKNNLYKINLKKLL
jgi:hypothetical protein